MTTGEPDSFIDNVEPSKSQRKREALEVRNLAGILVELSANKRAHLQLSAEIESAISQCPPARMRGARKRHLQFISKLLRNHSDPEQVRHMLDNPISIQPDHSQHESMRDRLIESFTAHADELRTKYPAVDMQQARQLVRKANTGKNAQPASVLQTGEPDSATGAATQPSRATAARSLLNLLISAAKNS